MSDQSLKKDAGKIPLELLDFDAIDGIGRVLAFGAQKYKAHGWRAGMEWSRLIGAALRHLTAMARGEDIDPESGLPHIDHLGCCWMFLSAYQKQGLGTDDRYKTRAATATALQSNANDFEALVECLRISPEQLKAMQCAVRPTPPLIPLADLGVVPEHIAQAYGYRPGVPQPVPAPTFDNDAGRPVTISMRSDARACAEHGCLRPANHPADWHSDGELAWREPLTPDEEDIRTVADPTEVLP